MKKYLKTSLFFFAMVIGFAASSSICCEATAGDCRHPNGMVFTYSTLINDDTCTGHECTECTEEGGIGG
ncbi:hypothetical protein [Marinoscillum sp.]|uniref:hypothetical protein n=1 Tax=Marinoscillum sp. TaxID=2024838 RepID=UPI003BAD4F52